MEEIIKKCFNTDKKSTVIIFYPPEGDYIITVLIEKFIEMFSIPLQKAIDSGTEPMDEIRAFDPENKLGYNNLIV